MNHHISPYWRCGLTAALILSNSMTCFAKPINLYTDPKQDAKVISTVDSEAGVITIFQPKDSAWVKVGDPRNGNVGWAKTADLNQATIHFNVVQTGNHPQGYQMTQYGVKPFSAEEMNRAFKEMEAHQLAIQKDMQHMMQTMFNDMPWRFPMIVPVVMVPQEKAPATPHNAKTTSQAKTN